MVREDDEMREEYDFSGGERGKHHRAMQDGHTLIIHKADGTVTKEFVASEKAIFLEPEVQEYFPDSESVNRALRCLIPLLRKS